MSPRSPTIGNAWSNAFVCMSPYVELTVLQNWKVSKKKVREWCRQLCSQWKKVEIWRKAFSASWNGHFSSSSSPQPPQTISSLEPTHFFLWGGGAAHCTTVRTLKCCPENKTDSATYNGTKSPLTYLKYYCLVVIYCIRCVIVSSQPFHHIFHYIFTFSISLFSFILDNDWSASSENTVCRHSGTFPANLICCLFNVNTISIWHILPSLKSTQYFSPEFSTEDIPSAAGGSIAVAKVNNGLSHSIFSSDVSEYVLYTVSEFYSYHPLPMYSRWHVCLQWKVWVALKIPHTREFPSAWT